MATSLSTPPSTPLSMTQIWNAYVLCSEYRGVIKKSHKSREELVYYPKSHVFAFRNKLFLGYSDTLQKYDHDQVAVPIDGPIYDKAQLYVSLRFPPYYSSFAVMQDNYWLSLSVKEPPGEETEHPPSLDIKLRTFRPNMGKHIEKKYFFTDCVRFIQLRIRALVTRMKAESEAECMLAVLMGAHPRLGSSSIFNLLDDDVLGIILNKLE